MLSEGSVSTYLMRKEVGEPRLHTVFWRSHHGYGETTNVACSYVRTKDAYFQTLFVLPFL